MLALNNNRGMTYQTDEKHLTNLRVYFVGVVNMAIYSVVGGNAICAICGRRWW
jgi:hypothetical protein